MSLIDPSSSDDNEETRAQAAQKAASESAAPQASDDEEELEFPADSIVPEKFRGKSAKEIIASYQSLETELGRARNEIGTNRRLVDELLQIRRPQQEKSKPIAEPVTPQALAERPEETIVSVAKRVADERVSHADQRLANLEARLTEQDLTARHGDFRQTLASSEFQSWVNGSKYRQSLIVRAASGDMEAGDEVLGLFKEHGPKPTPVPATDKTGSTESARTVATAKSGGSGANKVVTTETAKKTWTRSEITKLYINDPDEYNRLSDAGVFAEAYEQKRVK